MRLGAPAFVISFCLLALSANASAETFLRPEAQLMRIDSPWPSGSEVWTDSGLSHPCNFPDQTIRVERLNGSKIVSFGKAGKRYELELQTRSATQPGMITVYQANCSVDRSDESRRMFIDIILKESKSNRDLLIELSLIGFEDRIAARQFAPVFIETLGFPTIPALVSWSRGGIRFVANTQSGELGAYDELGRSVQTAENLRLFINAVVEQMKVDSELVSVIRNSSALENKFND